MRKNLTVLIPVGVNEAVLSVDLDKKTRLELSVTFFKSELTGAYTITVAQKGLTKPSAFDFSKTKAHTVSKESQEKGINGTYFWLKGNKKHKVQVIGNFYNDGHKVVEVEWAKTWNELL